MHRNNINRLTVIEEEDANLPHVKNIKAGKKVLPVAYNIEPSCLVRSIAE